jgi:hypothetical protein
MAKTGSPDRMKYLGVLGLLAESAVYVPEDIREQIESAMDDACADGRLRWKRVLNRIEIEPNPDYKETES